MALTPPPELSSATATNHYVKYSLEREHTTDTFSTLLEYFREPSVPPHTVGPLVWVIPAWLSPLAQHQCVIACICQIREAPESQWITVAMRGTVNSLMQPFLALQSDTYLVLT